MDDDAKLLQLYAREHSEKAFSELVQRHLRAVYAVVLRRVGGDVHLAEEATQDVFAALGRKAASLRSTPSVAGWLFVSARYASAKIVRREQRKRALPFEETLVNATSVLAESEPNWTVLRPLLDALIQNLNTADREALLLRFYEDRSFAEIGEVLRLPENTARMRVSRAIEKLRGKLLRQGIASTSVALAAGLAEQASAAVPATLLASVVSAAVANTTVSISLLSLMALTKTQTAIVAALIASGAAVVGFEQHREISSLRAQLSAQDTDLQKTKKQLSETSDKLAVSEIARQKLAAREPSSAASNSSAPSNTQEIAVIHLKNVFRDHPEMAAVQKRIGRRSIVAQYKAGLQQLHLPPMVESKLKELLVERSESRQDAYDIGTTAGAKPDSPEVTKAANDAAAPLNKAIKALIGWAAMDKLETLSGTSGYSRGQNWIAEISLIDAQQPLTPEQSAQLQEVYYQVNSPQQNPEAKDSAFQKADAATWLTKADTDYLTKAAAFLHPDQIETIRGALADENHNAEIMKQYTKGRYTVVVLP